MITFASTAMPTVSTTPAMPGSVSVARARLISPRMISTFTISAAFANMPVTL